MDQPDKLDERDASCQGMNIDEHSLGVGYIPALCGTPQHSAWIRMVRFSLS